jgi:hypothetical protein
MPIRNNGTKLETKAITNLTSTHVNHTSLIHSGLGDVVRQNPGEGANTVDAGHIDDVSSGLRQMGHCQHRQVVDRPHVCVHHPVVLVQTGGLYGAHLQDAGVVHQHVQPMEVFQGLPQHGAAVALLAHVADN